MTRRHEALLVLLLFFCSRLLYYRAGVRFSATSLVFFMQFLDPVLLRTRLLESLFYLHAQPPLFNLFLGVVLKLFPRDFAAVFALLFLACGAALTVLLYLLMRELGVGPLPGGALAMLFAASPAGVVYENLLFYTYPLTLALIGAGYLLYRYLQTGRTALAAGFFSALAAIALTRSLFHLGWMLLLTLLVVQARPLLRRQTLLAAALPLVLVTGWYAKNAVVFGQFSSSTWMGMSLAQMSVEQLSPDQRAELLRARLVSPLVNLHAYDHVAVYRPYIAPPRVPADVPALTQETKLGGWANFNHIVYIPVSVQYQRDSVQAIREYPRTFVRTVGLAFLIYSMPATQFMDVWVNSRRIPRAERAFAVLSGQLRGCPDPRKLSAMASGGEHVTSLGNVSWVWMAIFAAAMSWGLYEGLRRFRSDPATAATLLYLALNILWVSVIGNTLAMGENNRFRLTVDPLVLILAGVFLREKASHLGGSRRRRPQSASGRQP